MRERKIQYLLKMSRLLQIMLVAEAHLGQRLDFVVMEK